MTEQSTFEQSLTALEEKVEALSRGDLPLDGALAVFEEGLALYRRCRDMLTKAEQHVSKLVASEEGIAEEPFAVE